MTQRSRFAPPHRFDGVEKLEALLGDPMDPGNVLGFARAVALDDAERFPEDGCRRVDDAGVHEHYVPEALGGRFRSFEELGLVVRTLARRDLTVAIAHGKTFLGVVAIWIAGTEAQKRRLAQAVLAGHQVALALTEKEHGTDLLNAKTSAHPMAGGFRLTGTKWLVNNATRGKVLTVFARTDPEGGPRGFSLLVVHKNDLDRGSYEHLPKIKTHGIRGADISGIHFRGAYLSEAAVVGGVGHGFEVVLKSLLVTRTIIASLSMGAGDTALRLVLDFARARRVRTKTVAEIPHARRVLCEGFVDLLVCDALAITATRSLHVLPEQVSLFSAITKYFVPSTVEQIIQRLSVVLGARYYLREGHAHGMFQKILRDNALVSLFDGSTIVNLSALGQQLPRLSRHRSRGGRPSLRSTSVGADLNERRRSLFDLDAPLPAFDPSRLAVISNGDDVLEGLAASLAELETSEPPEVDPTTLEAIVSLGKEILRALGEQGVALSAMSSRPGAGERPELFALAESHAVLFAGATAFGFWHYNRAAADSFFAGGKWLWIALSRMLARVGRPVILPTDEIYEEVFQRLLELRDQNRLFSLLGLALASEAAPDSKEPTPLHAARAAGKGRRHG